MQKARATLTIPIAHHLSELWLKTASRERPKSALRSRLKRALLLKVYQNSKMKNLHFEKPPKAENCKRGTHWVFENPVGCKISKNFKGDPLETKNSKEKSQSAKKIDRGPFSLVRFCKCTKNSV